MAELEPTDFVQFLEELDTHLLVGDEVTNPTSRELVNNLLEGHQDVIYSPFAYEWCVWLDKTKPGAVDANSFAKGLKEIGLINSVATFCDLWNNLSKAENIFGIYSNLRLFKKGIQPLWEDPTNENGGNFIIREPLNFDSEGNSIPDPQIRMFLCILIHMVTGQLGFEDDICGAGLSIKPLGLVYSLWNKDSEDNTKVEYITARLKEILGSKHVDYWGHASNFVRLRTRAIEDNNEQPFRTVRGKNTPGRSGRGGHTRGRRGGIRGGNRGTTAGGRQKKQVESTSNGSKEDKPQTTSTTNQPATEGDISISVPNVEDMKPRSPRNNYKKKTPPDGVPNGFMHYIRRQRNKRNKNATQQEQQRQKNIVRSYSNPEQQSEQHVMLSPETKGKSLDLTPQEIPIEQNKIDINPLQPFVQSAWNIPSQEQEPTIDLPSIQQHERQIPLQQTTAQMMTVPQAQQVKSPTKSPRQRQHKKQYKQLKKEATHPSHEQHQTVYKPIQQLPPQPQSVWVVNNTISTTPDVIPSIQPEVQIKLVEKIPINSTVVEPTKPQLQVQKRKIDWADDEDDDTEKFLNNKEIPVTISTTPIALATSFTPVIKSSEKKNELSTDTVSRNTNNKTSKGVQQKHFSRNNDLKKNLVPKKSIEPPKIEQKLSPQQPNHLQKTQPPQSIPPVQKSIPLELKTELKPQLPSYQLVSDTEVKPIVVSQPDITKVELNPKLKPTILDSEIKSQTKPKQQQLPKQDPKILQPFQEPKTKTSSPISLPPPTSVTKTHSIDLDTTNKEQKTVLHSSYEEKNVITEKQETKKAVNKNSKKPKSNRVMKSAEESNSKYQNSLKYRQKKKNRTNIPSEPVTKPQLPLYFLIPAIYAWFCFIVILTGVGIYFFL